MLRVILPVILQAVLQAASALPQHRQYCIVGAGPAGVQLGEFLRESGRRNFVIIERANKELRESCVRP